MSEPQARSPIPLPNVVLHDAPTRIALRAWGRSGDAEALAAAWEDPDIVRWTAVPTDRSVDAAAGWIADETARREQGVAIDLAIVDGSDVDDVLGEVGLTVVEPARGFAEIGFWVASAHRGRSVARTAVHLVSTWALAELPVRTLFARIAIDNRASASVVKAAGYALVGQTGEGELEVWARTGGPGAVDRGGAGGTVDL